MADVREHLGEFPEIVENADDARQVQQWTSLPGEIDSFDEEKQTASVQPSLKSATRKPDGKSEKNQLPLLQDVPVQFASGGGMTMTWPLKKGDPVLIVFASRSIDQWHQSGGVQQQVSARMHDLSDAMAIPGIRPLPKKLNPKISTTETQIRSDDGSVSISINPTDKKITQKAGATTLVQTEQGWDFTGGHIKHNGKRIDKDHKHGGVVTGGDDTDVPSN
jgi:hypothetical protein